jgi:hypothetical protein
MDANFNGVVYPSRLSATGRLIAVFGAAGSTEPPENVIDVRPIQPDELERLGTRVVDVPDDDELTFVDLE